MPPPKRDLAHVRSLVENTTKRLKGATDENAKNIMKDAQSQFLNLYPVVEGLPQRIIGPLQADYEAIQPELLQKRATFINKELKKEFPEKQFSPISLPDAIQHARGQKSRDTKNLQIANPVEINADEVIALATRELKRGLKDAIAPEVLFWFNFLVPFRGNDANINHLRDNGDRCSAENLVYLDDYPGTIAVLLPSKAKVGNAPRPFCTVTIAAPEDYGLIKEALTFLLSEEAKEESCYSSLKLYQKRARCGSCSHVQWSSGKIRQRMIENSKINDLINWHGQKAKVDANLSRAFVACCIHKERIQFDRCLNVGDSAAEKALGHFDGSLANRAYMRFCVRPTQIEDKVLKKVTAPIVVNGVSIENGVYIAAK